MLRRYGLRRFAAFALLSTLGVVSAVGVHTYMDFQPAAITLGPETTLYFRDDPPLSTRVHEAVHRRQMRDKGTLGRLVNAVRYNFDYGYRLNEEAEAKAGEICLQIHKFTAELPAYTTARSRSQAEAYRAWAWERIGVRVPDRVGQQLQHGERCHEILRDVYLDLPPGEELDEREALKLATFHFLRSYGSTEREVSKWKARLRLVGYTEASSGEMPEPLPPFGLLRVARELVPEPDTALTPEDAGRALHRMTYYSADRMYAQLQVPDGPYRGRPIVAPGEAREQVGTALEDWADELLRRGIDGDFEDEEREWLEELAAHPIHEDFRTFALAPGADILGTRYRFDEDTRWDRLVLTELDAVREAFLLQWGRAALAAHQGDLEESASILREILAGAVQLAQGSPFEVDVLLGLDLVSEAMEGLARVQKALNEDPQDWMRRVEDVSPDRWTRGPRRMLFSDDAASIYRAMPAIANDPGIPHAFRRSAYRQVVLFDVCMAQRRDEESRSRHRAWRASVETGLARHDSDRKVLELMRESVQDLLRASDVAPERICDPVEVVRPDARMAIMVSPLRSSMLMADEDR